MYASVQSDIWLVAMQSLVGNALIELVEDADEQWATYDPSRFDPCLPSSGISLGDALRLPKRHPACRRREAQPGSCMERENLDGDAKGKGASGSNREAESTDAPARGGLLRSSVEAG
jgi:hypothetical protein